MPTPTADRPSPGRAVRIALFGLLTAGVVSAVVEHERIEPVAGDLELAIPVPGSARLVDRRIDRNTGRSIAVIDVDPTTPPTWSDVYVVVRRHALPGVLLSYATEPADVPDSSESIDAWRAFAAGSSVRLEPHPDLRSARAVMEAGVGRGSSSGNPTRGPSLAVEADPGPIEPR